MAEGRTVTFDSDEKDKDLNGTEIRKTVYGDFTQEGPIVIEYNDGLKIQHVIASASLPEFYEYEEKWTEVLGWRATRLYHP